MLSRLDVASGAEQEVADLGPIPPALALVDSLNEFAYRGFSLHPDGRSFLTSVLRIKTQIYLMRDFDRRHGSLTAGGHVSEARGLGPSRSSY